MNLAEVLFLYAGGYIRAGGPGSGCNPDAGHCGRHKGQEVFDPSQFMPHSGDVLVSDLDKAKVYAVKLSDVPHLKDTVEASRKWPAKDRIDVRKLADAFERGDKIPPVEMIYEKDGLHIDDGVHRLVAAWTNGETYILAKVVHGGLRKK